MKKSVIGFISALSLAAVLPTHAADQSPAAIIGAKIVVKDYQKSIDFYTKLGLKVGQKYGPTELEMLSDNAQAPKLILIHDDSGQMKRTPGGSSLMMLVPDVKATAQALKDAGYPGIGEPKTSQRAAVSLMDPGPTSWATL